MGTPPTLNLSQPLRLPFSRCARMHSALCCPSDRRHVRETRALPPMISRRRFGVAADWTLLGLEFWKSFSIPLVPCAICRKGRATGGAQHYPVELRVSVHIARALIQTRFLAADRPFQLCADFVLMAGRLSSAPICFRPRSWPYNAA